MFRLIRAVPLASVAILGTLMTGVPAASAAPARHAVQLDARTAASAPDLSAAPAAVVIPLDLPGNIVNQYTGKCIGIANGVAGDWTCTHNADQTWHWGASVATGWYQLINGNGQCLAVDGGTIRQGSRILGFKCVGSADQYWWRYAGVGPISNYKGFSDPDTAWVIGVGGGSTSNGAPVVLWPDDGSTNQLWNY
jgi:hypothetical protein